MADKGPKFPGRRPAEVWTNHLRGSFGAFTAVGGMQISYLSTRMGVSELRSLKTARQVLPRDELTIRELMQRDIDDERVRRDIVKYLTPLPGHNTAKFFPPLVVAVLVRDSKRKELVERYPAPVDLKDGAFPRRPIPAEDNMLYEERLYGSAFGVRIPIPDLDSDISSNPLSHGAELVWNRDVVELMVIDGQHRLVALKAALDLLGPDEAGYGYEGAELAPAQLKQLGFESVAVCIVFPPELYEGNKSLMPNEKLVTLFRQVFVDVNKNARPVSESRNILLNERDLIAVFTRNVIEECPPVAHLPKDVPVGKDTIPLYAFEWESPDGKERQINDERAVSSVGLLESLVSRMLLKGGDKQDTFRSALGIEDGDAQLDPDKNKKEGPAPIDITTTVFAGWQRTALEVRFKTRWQGAVQTLLRRLYPANDLIGQLEKRRVALKKGRKSEAEYHGLALEYLLGTRSDQRHIQRIASREDKRVGGYDVKVCLQVVKNIRDEFLQGEIAELRGGHFARLYFSNLGQSQLFDFVFNYLMENLPAKSAPAPTPLAEAFTKDFNAAFRGNAAAERLFDPEQSWNALVIQTLGMQRWKHAHVRGLLLIGANYYPVDGALASLCVSPKRWEGFRADMVGAGLRAMNKVLVERLKAQIRYDPDIVDIRDPAAREERIVSAATDKARRILKQMKKHLELTI